MSISLFSHKINSGTESNLSVFFFLCQMISLIYFENNEREKGELVYPQKRNHI
jgi:hypothetical protein